jgi:hypothetical protein
VHRIVIHIGTHKTGTTSIQAFLAKNRTRLKECGILYPYAGTRDRLPGPHNIAWELSGDARFDPRMGTVSDLLSEVCRSEERTTILSSEDFEYLPQHPHALMNFDSMLVRAGFSTEYVVLFRSTDTYGESLYHELLERGLTVSEHDFRVRIKKDQYFLRNDGWFFEFDRARFVRRWTEILGGKMSSYGFDHMISRRGLLPEFMTLIGASDSIVRESETAPRRNQRRPLDTVQGRT